MYYLKMLPLLAMFFFISSPLLALEPKEVFLLVNKNSPESQEIAQYYCKQRQVPTQNILGLDLPKEEDISRTDYDRKMREPIRKALADKKDQAKVLLSIYGVPLRVGPVLSTEAEKKELETLGKEIDVLQKQLQNKQEEKSKLDELRKELTQKEERRRKLRHDESQAAVDSELMHLWWEPYPIERWQLNPLYFQVPTSYRDKQAPMIMTCRLDGPSVKVVKRLIDDAITTEAKGLEGQVYVDARGIKWDLKQDIGLAYGGYDESMREMARLLEKAELAVTLDDKEELFAVGNCKDCALYCGWYSLAKFVDCCEFVPGSIAWHLASSEAVTLRDPKTPTWCKNLLEKGAAVTLGPVSEPYTVGFPKPAEFFGLLVTGEYTVVECYSRTVMLSSWMMTLVGDPLYNPFAKKPRLKKEQILPSPKNGKFAIEIFTNQP